jgi:hypothetical protein
MVGAQRLAVRRLSAAFEPQQKCSAYKAPGGWRSPNPGGLRWFSTFCFLLSAFGLGGRATRLTGSKSPAAAVLATLTGHPVYAMFDKNGQAVTETTTLGAAIAGKAACLGIHPYKVDTSALGVKYRQMTAFTDELAKALLAYRVKWMQQVSGK